MFLVSFYTADRTIIGLMLHLSPLDALTVMFSFAGWNCVDVVGHQTCRIVVVGYQIGEVGHVGDDSGLDCGGLPPPSGRGGYAREDERSVVVPSGGEVTLVELQICYYMLGTRS